MTSTEKEIIEIRLRVLKSEMNLLEKLLTTHEPVRKLEPTGNLPLNRGEGRE
jgi:hypothetical protein